MASTSTLDLTTIPALTARSATAAAVGSSLLNAEKFIPANIWSLAGAVTAALALSAAISFDENAGGSDATYAVDRKQNLQLVHCLPQQLCAAWDEMKSYEALRSGWDGI